MACDDLITNQDLENAKKDATTMSDFVESDSPEIQSKNGKNIRTLQGINDAADNLISSLGGTDIGDYEDDLTLNSYNEYVVFDRAGASTGPSLWKAIPPRTPMPGTPLPYTIDSSLYPDPTSDPNIEPFSDINKAGAEQIAQEEANAGDSQLAGGTIWPLSSQDSLSLGAQSSSVPTGVNRLRVNTGSEIEVLYLWEKSGDFGGSAQTVTNITSNATGGYDVVTNIQTYEFTTESTRNARGYNSFPTLVREASITGWGAKIDGSTNDSPSINAAMAYARANRSEVSTITAPPGQISIEEPIKLLQSVSFMGSGTLGGSAGGTEIICNFPQSVIDNPPTDNYDGERFSPVFEFTPMLYNTELITQQNFGGFRLNGNGLDVRGIYITDMFYTNWKPMFIVNCNKAPITFVVNQFNYMEQLTCNNNNAGPRFIGNDTLIINELDTEGNSITGSQLDIIQDVSTKSGVTINEWHYEETSSAFPTIFAQISGRNVTINSLSMGLSGSNPLRPIFISGVGTYNFDGQSFTAIDGINSQIKRMSASVGVVQINLRAGAVGAEIVADSATVNNLVDNSGSNSNLVQAFTQAPTLPRDSVIQNSTRGRMLFFSGDDTINFFDNTNRRLQQSGADLDFINTSGRIDYMAQISIGSYINGVETSRSDAVTTAGATRFLLYDNDSGSLQRVLVGANNSGPGGSGRALYIANS